MFCRPVIFFLLLFLSGSSMDGQGQKHNGTLPVDSTLASVPGWAKKAIWYQIFVERFRNGDHNNDPTPADMYGSYPEKLPADWEITPWGHDWYAHEQWLDNVAASGFSSRIQARRYGGDLQGVLDKIDYIASLGINAVYFNPLNDSPSLHKYDARTYTHIDRNFGPDPKGDELIMKQEVHNDPSTWKWTSADSLFLNLVKEFHSRGIKVILDYSWNHTGRVFWALDDIRKNGKKSEFVDWYNIIRFDDPDTPQDEMQYEGWGGNNPWMPVFRKDIIPPDDKVMPFEGNLHSGSLKKHIFDVTKRWLDPDGDGDPSDGIDGFRLDVAGEIPMGFWREYRKVVRSVNPEAYLVGEIWWLAWPDKLMDPSVYLQRDQFDAVMNYRWYRIARGLFAQADPVLKPTEFVSAINRINHDINTDNLEAMMNVASTHDSPRLSTSLYNKTLYKVGAKPGENPQYKINRPDTITRKQQLLLLVNQFTYIGAPQIWNGEEAGMWGADDPDCRKPVVWDDIKYEDEKTNFDLSARIPADKVKVDTALLDIYRTLCRLRSDNPVLSGGNLSFLVADDKKMLLAYKRYDDNDEIIVFFNCSGGKRKMSIENPGHYSYTGILPGENNYSQNDGDSIRITLAPYTAAILKRTGKY